MSNVTPKLFPYNQVTATLLRPIQVVPDKYSEAVLIGVRMSLSWHARGTMSIFYVIVDGKYFFLYYLLLPPPLFS